MASHKHPKRRLSRIQYEIISALEEAGEEYVTTIVNNVCRRHGDFGNQMIELVEREYRPLVYGGLIEVEQEPNVNGKQPALVKLGRKVVLVPLADIVAWNDEVGYWRWNEVQGGPNRARFVLTRYGRQQVGGVRNIRLFRF